MKISIRHVYISMLSICYQPINAKTDITASLIGSYIRSTSRNLSCDRAFFLNFVHP